MRRFILFVVFATACFGQTSSRNSPQHGNQISGVVLDSVTHTSVSGAQVYIRSVDSRTVLAFVTLSESDGTFLLSDIDSGNYTLGVLHDSYVPMQFGESPVSQPTIISVGNGEAHDRVEVGLVRPGLLVGRVTDGHGLPVPFARVQALSISYRTGTRRLLPVQQSVTNDLGEYRMAGVAPGLYVVSAIHPGRRRSVRAEKVVASALFLAEDAKGYSETFYPSTTSVSLAEAIEVAAGEVRGPLDVRLVQSKQSSIAGTVLLGAGQVGTNLLVQLWAVDGFGRSVSAPKSIPIDNARGAFEFSQLSPGSYLLGARANGQSKQESWSYVNLGSESVQTSLIMQPLRELRGSVRVATEAKLTSEISLQLTGSGIAGPVASPVDKDGRFVAPGIAPDLYSVAVVTAQEDVFIERVRSSGADVTDAPIRVSVGERPNLEVVVNTGGGSIEGFVRDIAEKPVAQATVVLVPELSRRQNLRLFKAVPSGGDGGFRIHGIAPGQYKLFAWSSIPVGAWFDPEILRTVETQGISIAVERLSSSKKDVHLATRP